MARYRSSVSGSASCVSSSHLALPICAGSLGPFRKRTRSYVRLSVPRGAGKSGETAKNKSLPLTAILGDSINLGLSQMAELCPGMTYARLSWLQAWPIRDQTYSEALAELVNGQSCHPFADHCRYGTISSCDGQRFKVGGKAKSKGHINPKYGAEPGRTFYTHLSDQFAPYHAKRSTWASGCYLCARWPALPRVGPAHRGTLHRHCRLYRSRLRVHAYAGFFALRRGSATWERQDSTCPSERRHTPP